MRQNGRLGWYYLIPSLLIYLGASAALAAPADRAEALTYLGQGADAYRMGDVAEAIRRWGEAIRLCRLAGDTATEADVLAQRGEAFQTLGQLRAAAGDLEQAQQRAEALRDTTRLAAISGSLGNIYFQAHDFGRAQSLVEKSLSLARQNGLTPVIAASANNLGNLRIARGDLAGATSAYSESIGAAAVVADTPLVVTATTNKARVLSKQGREAESLDLLETALRDAATLSTSADTAYALIAIGRLAQGVPGAGTSYTSRRQALAHAALRQGAKIADSLHDARAASLSYGYTAELYEAAGRREEAAGLAQHAIFLAQQIDAPDLLYRWDWLSGRLARAAGDRNAAIGAYRRAVSALQTIRQDIPVDYIDGRSSFRETMGPLYFELADLLLQASADPKNTPRAPALLQETRTTIEALKTAEIRDYFKDRCLVPLEAQGRVTANAAESSRTATLYPVILPNRVELLVAFPNDQTLRFTTPVDEATLTSKVRELRLDLETLGTREYIKPAQQLYDWLIQPIAQALAAHHVDTLIIVPDGVMRTIPFAALYDGTSFLIQHYALATELGLTLIDPKPLARQPLSALLSGLSKAAQGYPALPFVTRELDSLKHMAASSMVLENEDFLRGRMEHALKTVPYSVVHIASHAEFNNDPQRTFILTYDGRLTLDQLENTVKYSAFRDQPLELLTLSACQTAAGDDRAALGLAGVAIKAGARSAVASLWFINDEAASRLITQFYQELRKSDRSKAQAMQQAQLQLIEDRRFRHPGYWSAFLVIGNWL